jgi:hypothetical protein
MVEERGGSGKITLLQHPGLHGPPGDAMHRPETRGFAALLTMRVTIGPHPEEHRTAMRLEG